MPGRVLIVTALVAATLAAAPARADQALDLVREAKAKLKQADFERSMELLGQARRLTDDPKVLGQIYLHLGLNHAVMGQTDRARPTFRTALTYDPVLVLDPTQIKASVVKLFSEVRGGLRGELTVQADPPGAEVTIDGKRVGVTPLRNHELTIGAHEVEVRSAGGARVRRTVVIGVNQESRLSAALKPQGAVAVRSPRSGAGEPAGHPSTAPRQDAPEGRRRRLWTWVAAGGAAAVLIAGVGVGAAARVDHDDWEQESDPGRWDELRSSGQAKATAANVLFGVGGALAVTAVVLFFLEGRPERAPDAAQARLTPVLGPGGVGLTGTF